jgi:predicted RNA-binding Zn ribbon-like protein
MTETYEPTAATTRLDGGHPVLDLVNTVYGQVGGPVEHDVLSQPADLVVLAGRWGLVEHPVPADAGALVAARSLRAAVDALLRARLAGTDPPPAALGEIESALRAAYAAGGLVAGAGSLAWIWPGEDPYTPVHRLTVAAVELLTDPTELGRLHCCAGCCWLYLDRSRGAGRRWCSMAECGTDAKKRRYVQRRRERRRS